MTQRHLRAICVAVRDGHVFSNVDGQSTLTPTGGGATGGDGGGKNSRVSAPVGRSTRATHSAYAARSSAVVTTVVEQSGTLAATEVVTATEYRDASQLEAPEPNACCTAVAISAKHTMHKQPRQSKRREDKSAICAHEGYLLPNGTMASYLIL